MSDGICYYCPGKGPIMVSAAESGMDHDLFVCKQCRKLLKRKETALPLIRGAVTMKLRGQISPSKLEKAVNDYMLMLSSWSPRN